VHCVADEFEAATVAMTLARPGDIVFLAPTDVDLMWEHVKSFRASAPRLPAERMMNPANDQQVQAAAHA